MTGMLTFLALAVVVAPMLVAGYVVTTGELRVQRFAKDRVWLQIVMLVTFALS
jgi:hypothetical protein